MRWHGVFLFLLMVSPVGANSLSALSAAEKDEAKKFGKTIDETSRPER